MSKLFAGRTFDYLYEGETFKLAILSGLQSEELTQLTVDFKSTDRTAQKAALNAMVALTIKGGPFEGDPRASLTDRECWDLIAAATKASVLTADERKKFGSGLKLETD